MLNYHSSSTSNNIMSFSNQEVIITTYNDKRLISYSESSCRTEQEECGPTFIAIRPNATDDQLNKIANRYSLPIEDLKLFRGNVAV